MRARVGLLVVCLIGLAACRSHPDAAVPLRPVVHLAEQGHQQADGVVPTVTIDSDVRPTLTDMPKIPLGRAQGTVGRRPVKVHLHIPPDARTTPLRLSALAMIPGARVVDVQPHLLTQPRARARARVTIEAPPAATGPVYVLGFPPVERTYETEPLPIPHAARLRFAIGVATFVPTHDLQALFTLRAIEGSDDRVLFQGRQQPSRYPEDRRWTDYEVDLAAYEGRSVRLRFETDVMTDDTAAVANPAWGDPTVVAPLPSAEKRRSVLLVSLDTLRADHLGCYGYRRPTSPTIDRFAAEGTLFERAYSSFPSTPGSHMTLLTGLYPCVHRVTAFGAEHVLRPDAVTLAEHLRAHGYETAAFTEDGWVTADLGFARGFGTFVENRSPDMTQPAGEAVKTFGGALAWIRRHADRPWFVFAHTYQVHLPYVPPPGYLEEVASNHARDDAAVSEALYDGEIRYTDDVLAKFLAGVAAAVPDPPPIVILVADHGEQFGEHGLFTHGNSLYDVLLHVPLIVRAPGLVPAGKRVADNVGLVDVVPTVLQLLGLPPPAWSQGRSLVPLLHGGRVDAAVLYANLPFPKQVAIRTGSAKWIISEDTGAADIYLPFIDPRERAPSRKHVSGQAPQMLAKYHAECAAPSPPPVPTRTIEPDPAVQEKLKALGYTN